MFSTPRRLLMIASAVVLAAVITGVTVWWFGGPGPAAVDADRAVSEDGPAREMAEEDPEGGSAPEPPVEPDQLTGTWIVDTSREFDLVAGRGTFVGYRVDEELAGIGSTTAVGRTPEVAGRVMFDQTRLTQVEIEADLTALVSDDRRRDGRVRDMLGPDATALFSLDDTIDLGEVPRVGEVIELQAAGQLTIGDAARPVTVAIEAALTETGMVVAGSTRVLLADFEVSVPSAAIVLSASDEAVIEWQLYLRRE